MHINIYVYIINETNGKYKKHKYKKYIDINKIYYIINTNIIYL